MSAGEPRWPSRLARALRRLAKVAAVASALVVVGAMLLVAALHTARARELVRQKANQALADAFRGRVEIDAIARMGLTGVDGVDARVEAPDGTRVVTAHGVSARIAPMALLASAVGRGDVRVTIPEASVEAAEVALTTDDGGVLKIQRAFELRPVPSPSGSAARAVRLTIADIAVGHGRVREWPRGAPPIDATADRVRASLNAGPDDVVVRVTQGAVAARGVPGGADAEGTLTGRIEVQPPSGPGIVANGAFHGAIGGIATTVTASIDRDRIDAAVDVPETPADKVRALWPQAPVARPASAHVEAHGSLAASHVTVLATVGPTRVQADGDVSIGARTTGSLHAEIRDADLRAFVPEAPASRADLSIEATLEATAEGALTGHVDVTLRKGTIADRPLPSATVQGDALRKEGSSGVELTARAKVAQPGAPTDIVATLHDAGGTPSVHFQTTTRIDDLSVVARGSGSASGHGVVRVDGALSLSGAPSIDATLGAELAAVRYGPAQAEQVGVVAHATGAVANPSIDGAIDAQAARVGDFAPHEVHATTRGTLSRQQTTLSMRGDPYDVRADAILEFGPGVRVSGAAVDLTRDATCMHLEADHVVVEPGRFDLEGARVTGVGAPGEVTMHLRPRSLQLRAESPDLDLKSLGHLFGVDTRVRGGHAAIRADISAQPDRAEGTATLEVRDGAFFNVDGVSARLDARLDGRSLRGTMNVAADGVGSLNAPEILVDLGGNGPLDAPSWRRSWGKVRFEGQADLAKIEALLPPDALPFSSIGGSVTVHGHLFRDGESDVTPDLALSLQTSNLTLASRTAPETRKDGVTVAAAPGFVLSGVDLHVDASANGDSGFTEVAARLTDATGTLVTLDAKSDAVPYGSLLASRGDLRDRLLGAPISAIVDVPSRDVKSLPEVLRVHGVRGEFAGTATLRGTGLAPSIELRAAAHRLRFDSLRNAAPLDGDLAARYDGRAAEATLTLGADGKTTLVADGHANAPIDRLLADPAAWDASVEAAIDDLALESIPTLADRRFHGSLRGRVELTGLHKDARASADIAVDRLRIGRTSYGSATASGAFDGQVLTGSALFQQSDGSARADLRFGLDWGAALLPSFDRTRMTRTTLDATHFRIAFLAPFVPNVFDELDGRIDAHASASLVPDQKPAISGSAVLSDGVVSLTALGQEFRSVGGKVTLQSDGTVRVDDVSAAATTGRLTASGDARLEGPAVVGADATLKIAKGDAMPLEVQGTPVGTSYGQVTLRATTSADHKTMSVSVDVPSWHLTLPDASTHAVQDLQPPPPEVHVGVYASPDHFVQAHAGATPNGAGTSTAQTAQTTIAVHLGSDVEVKRGTDLRVSLDGDLVAHPNGPRPRVTGQIRLHQGTLSVQGKSFEIQTGTLTFLGDPSNPEVRVTAQWQAPDGTRVYADYAGPLKTGKVTLRSDPGRPQNEILALILFGSADGSSSTPYATQSTDAATTAGSAVGGFATGGLSQGIDKLTGLDVTAKIDTSQANPRPELQVQIARSISLELAYVIGTPPLGSNPDTTYATVGWRFLRNWSLETTLGNLGSTIADVVWQRRY